jgi:GAF domain-containing protein
VNVSSDDGVVEPVVSADTRFPVAVSRVTNDANLSESLLKVAIAGRDLLANCKSTSVTLIPAGRPVTMAATDDVAVELDRAQYEVSDGPCLRAAREEQLIRIDDIERDERWPAFRQAARRHDVANSLSVPLLMEEPETFGALNIYGTEAFGFGEHHVQLAEGFASQASIVVANVVAYWRALEAKRNLTTAMTHRGVIEQAKGILMATHHCSPDEAFTLLRVRSQAENRKLRDIAMDIVAAVQSDGGT